MDPNYSTFEKEGTQKTPSSEGYFWYHKNSNLTQTFIGGSGLVFFILIWISSLLSPFFLYASIQYKQYFLTALITLIVSFAYMPWKKGLISNACTEYMRKNHYYYKTSSVKFLGASLPDSGAGNGKDKKPKLYGVHPHGAFCLGWSILFVSPLMTTVRFIFSPALYMSPFFRLFCRAVGNPGAADKASMIYYMKQGENLAIPPGGFEEATLTSPEHDRVYIKNRAGFLKLALQHGYEVVPVYCFGEKNSYLNVQGWWKARLKLNSFGIPAIMIWGSPLIPLLPRRHRHGLHVVLGDPLQLPKIPNPSREEVKIWHDKYIAALVKIFDDHKCDAYGEEGKTMKLELW